MNMNPCITMVGMLLPLWAALLSRSGIDNTVNLDVPYENAQIVAIAGNN